ncbi:MULTISPECIES: tyrosine-type recombinase/integrase [Cyanophyceae]|nr:MULTISPECIES: tyrosine-type recombinase/integrase [Cyanophyceae]SMH48581.1 integrase/recombinase XerD [Picosynechococcus sp. OG1]ACB00892.1 integrase/recombinase [Picosynechococcus sp. PCC 7002]ACB01091.1 integrase/recombinase [Picosynechococcus sp. PCC 7002]SMH58942.1 integrase/recombinase XerD [Picosynechococcus sp. OG1]SMQ81347.1 integrase/recombinase XerD [Synechococcus sp. 7002]
MNIITITEPITQGRLTTATTDNEILKRWASQKSSATQKTYFYIVRNFMAAIAKPLNQITLDDLLDWLDSLQWQSQNTRRNKIAVIRSLFGFCHATGYITLNPAKLLQQPKENDCRIERIITKPKVQAMAMNADTLRNELIIKTLYLLGVRVSELINIRWDDFIQTDDNGLKLKVMGKGDKVRFIVVPTGLWDELEALRNDSAYVFSSRKGNNGSKLSRIQVYRVVKANGDRVGVQVSPHFLRHSHATHSLKNGCDLHLLSESLGHGNIAITSRYLHASGDDGSANYLSL